MILGLSGAHARAASNYRDNTMGGLDFADTMLERLRAYSYKVGSRVEVIKGPPASLFNLRAVVCWRLLCSRSLYQGTGVRNTSQAQRPT